MTDSTLPSPDTDLPARPDVAPAGPWAFPLPQTSSLANGLTVHAYDLPGQYVLSLRLVVPLNVRTEPRDKEGVASLMTRLLDEGSKRHTTEEFTELLECKGVAFAAGLSDGGLHVDLDVPQRNLGPALDLMYEAVAEPAFPEDQVRRLVRSRLAEIEQERASAPHRAARELAATFYDPSERASRPAAGTAETVSGLTRSDVADFHAAHVGPTHATLVVAGDLTEVDVTGIVERTLGEWAPLPVPVAPAPEAPKRASDAYRIVLVDRPDSVQTEITIACAGPDRHVEPAWAAYPVLGFIVGGSPSARIDAVLREEKGYTYGMRASFRPRRAGGLFATSGSVRTEVTAPAVELVLDILDGVRTGISERERAEGVDFIRGTAPGRFATADAVAEEAAGLVLDGLPPTFTTDNLETMGRLTAADLDTAYRRFVDGSWCIVLVGDAAAYTDAIRALGRGEVSVVAN